MSTADAPRAAELAAEAEAFDRRITERVAAGFVPDLRRAVPCEHFYKSFWRDPHAIDLYLGRLVERFLETLRMHVEPGATVLDVGCGAGYVALELARHGYRVTGIDIAAAAIDTARRTAEANPFTEAFGSLEYVVTPLAEIDGRFDAVLCSGVLHHMPQLDEAVDHLHRLLEAGGVLLASEPTHERWRAADAAQVALVRAMLAVAGMWFEPEEADVAGDDAALRRRIADVHREYCRERDPDEPEGQSPNDNSVSGEAIFAALDRRFERLACVPTVSFIYRLLGGLRGDDRRRRAMAELLAAYDRVATADGLMEANGRLYVGRR